MFLCGCVSSLHFSVQEWIAGSRGDSVEPFEELPDFSKVTAPFYILPGVGEGSSFSSSLLTFVILSYFCHLPGYEGITRCNFDFHFPGNIMLNISSCAYWLFINLQRNV